MDQILTVMDKPNSILDYEGCPAPVKRSRMAMAALIVACVSPGLTLGCLGLNRTLGFGGNAELLLAGIALLAPSASFGLGVGAAEQILKSRGKLFGFKQILIATALTLADLILFFFTWRFN